MERGRNEEHGTIEAQGRQVGTVWDGLEEMRGALHALLARQCADENDVEDVIQETFLRVARYRRAHRVKSLRPWAMRIALNVLADTRRRLVRAPSEGLEGEAFDPPAPPAASAAETGYRVDGEWLDGETAQELLRGTLVELREGDRRLLGSFYGSEPSSASVARECGVPRRVVKVRLYRARQRLLAALRQRVGRELEGRARAS